MDKIRCRAKHTKEGGCYNCGGFKALLEKRYCPWCGKLYWDRLRRGTTVYEGKEYTAFDGTEIVYSMKHGSVHAFCYDGRTKRKV